MFKKAFPIVKDNVLIHQKERQIHRIGGQCKQQKIQNMKIWENLGKCRGCPDHKQTKLSTRSTMFSLC